MGEYIIAHDVGTGGSKAVLVDTSGKVMGKSFRPYPVYYPRPDWAEQEPEDWWTAIAQSTQELLAHTGVSPQEIIALTFSTQMLGIVPMDAQGCPLRRPIIWLDNRATRQAQRMMRKFLSPALFALIAGAPLGGKDGMPKLLWLKENEPQLYRDMFCFLDVNGYLLYRSTGRMVMELSGASVFGLDLKKKTWLAGLMGYVGLDPKKLPPLVRSTEVVGNLTPEAASALGLLAGTPVVAGAGDAPSAAVGSGAVGEGEGHLYLGTSGWIGVVTRKTYTGRYGAAVIHSADPERAFLFAEMETAGACVRWIAEEFYKSELKAAGFDAVYALMDQEAGAAPPGSGYLIFTPWMYGERVPISDTWVRSTFLNLSADHQRGNLMRAIYEGIAYNLRWTLEIVERHFHFPLPTLRVVGGGAKSRLWMQILADITGRRVEVTAEPQEAGARGVALIAAIGLGIYPGFEALKPIISIAATYEPRSENRPIYDFLFQNYKASYRYLKKFYRQINQPRFAAAPPGPVVTPAGPPGAMMDSAPPST